MNYRFVLSGGPGGGKTTILNALVKHGYDVVSESAREVIRERLNAGLSARPDPVPFARDILRRDIEKYRNTDNSVHPTFFDRGILDAMYMLDAENALVDDEAFQYVHSFPYNATVFLLPPWREIYQTDSERDQTFEQAIDVFEGLKRWYLQWGYKTLEVPPGNLEYRLSFILSAVDLS
ncbi:AAA family ATPase [Cellvibrio polysaccharolyticus]|uniref:NadR/Ttd14 AAA domain-containing protein n=1 Tax=Cellvibrio polysaccharolyticus TaxID=2082724 RepID=A0A928YUR8_9GAMM|nr:AAA family ATPase [Cellvibrio polysaccharolyticus]MBE8718244.1 hypothetical protein [Cellvibrio polysaccharolyticus]